MIKLSVITDRNKIPSITPCYWFPLTIFMLTWAVVGLDWENTETTRNGRHADIGPLAVGSRDTNFLSLVLKTLMINKVAYGRTWLFMCWDVSSGLSTGCPTIRIIPPPYTGHFLAVLRFRSYCTHSSTAHRLTMSGLTAAGAHFNFPSVGNITTEISC